MCVAASALLLAGCGKDGKEEVKDTTPAELKSVSFLKADNADLLAEDVTVGQITENMVVRIKGGGSGKTLVATLTAGEFDVIKVNDGTVPASGKIAVDATYPIDIVVTNSKSDLSKSYELKVGKILETTVKELQTYTGNHLNGDFAMAVNPKTNEPYIAYTDSESGETDGNNICVIKWNGTSFDAVGNLGIADISSRNAVLDDFAFDADGTPYVLYKGAEAGSTSKFAMKKFNGTAWELVGSAPINADNITNAYGVAEIWFPSEGKPAFVTTGNYKKATNGTYRNAACYSFNGSEWAVSGGISGLPKYGEKGGHDGMFYRACFVTAGGSTYMVTSCNLYGYYVFKYVDNAWKMIVENFIPSGDYGLPGNLKAVASPAGDVYFLAASVTDNAMGVFKLDVAAGKLTQYSGLIPVTIPSNGAVSESVVLGINPSSGQFVCVKDAGGDNKTPQFAVIDENEQWTSFSEFGSGLSSFNGYSLEFASDGTGYLVMATKDENKVVTLHFFKVGLEDDVLPE